MEYYNASSKKKTIKNGKLISWLSCEVQYDGMNIMIVICTLRNSSSR
jgi:hypothetical protein